VFSNSWALVTGASSGIGEEFARELAKRGAHLILTARSGDKLERLAAELSAGREIEVRVVAQDLSEPGGARELCRKVDELGVFVEHEARRSICVPGAVSTITAAVSRLLPQRLVARTAGAAMRRMGRDRQRA
jgi:NAD(P)-dependent dehydrogenase (short-subunit alcohol dehydrogenase family)